MDRHPLAALRQSRQQVAARQHPHDAPAVDDGEVLLGAGQDELDGAAQAVGRGERPEIGLHGTSDGDAAQR